MTKFAVFLHALQCESQLNHAQNEVFLVGGVETANLVKSCYAKMINQQFIQCIIHYQCISDFLTCFGGM